MSRASGGTVTTTRPGATSTSTSETDVLVVGAGPTGLTLAGELLRRGVRCRVIDRAAAPATTSRAMGIQARTLELLDLMGVVERFLARGLTDFGVSAYAGDRRLFRLNMELLATKGVPYPSGLLVSQQVTETLLFDLLRERGGNVERSKELVDLRQDVDGVVARVRRAGDGAAEEIHARWVVGCDGAHSVVRHLLGLAFAGSTYDEAYLLADVDLDWDKGRRDVCAWLHRDGQFAAMPLPGGQWRLFADVSAHAGAAAAPPEPSLELFQGLLRERTGDRTTIISRPTWLSTFRINRRMVDRYRVGRVFLAGDAAHIHSPFGGQGMNTGMQDACNLAWKLALVARGTAWPDLLDSYQEERLPVARGVLRATHGNTRLFYGRHRAVRFLRDYVVVPLLALGPVQQRLLRAASQLDVHYRRSSLSRTAGERPTSIAGWLASRRAPRAGDRAPEAPCLQIGAGARTPTTLTPTTLFQQLRTPAFTLLLFDGGTRHSMDHEHLQMIAHWVGALAGEEVQVHLVARAAEPPTSFLAEGSVLLDPTGEFHARYGAGPQTVCLIRPDGYVGFRGRRNAEGPLLDYLARIFVSTAGSSGAPTTQARGEGAVLFPHDASRQ